MSDDRWSKYYDVTGGREPRDLFVRGFESVDPLLPKIGADIGFGAGNEVLFLLNQGWKAIAIDAENEAGERLRSKVGEEANLELIISKYENVSFPSTSLLHAGYAIPFCHPDHFEEVWQRLSNSISTGGIFCGQLFGVNDAWSDNESMTFHSRDQVTSLLSGFEILELEEEEGTKGTATGGDKYWHIFHIMARKL
ncbi:MAG: class I SAM-dependent methyltransferase [Candidatus Kariarchaeaceae archaeon]|jgi:hypothetical protein